MQTVRRLNEEGRFPFSVLIQPPRVSFEMDVMNRFEITSVSHKKKKQVQNIINIRTKSILCMHY